MFLGFSIPKDSSFLNTSRFATRAWDKKTIDSLYAKGFRYAVIQHKFVQGKENSDDDDDTSKYALRGFVFKDVSQTDSKERIHFAIPKPPQRTYIENPVSLGVYIVKLQTLKDRFPTGSKDNYLFFEPIEENDGGIIHVKYEVKTGFAKKINKNTIDSIVISHSFTPLYLKPSPPRNATKQQ